MSGEAAKLKGGLSSKIMGLKFMQRAKEKETLAKAEAQAEAKEQARESAHLCRSFAKRWGVCALYIERGGRAHAWHACMLL